MSKARRLDTLDELLDPTLMQGKPFVYTHEGKRFLHFDIGTVQSQMSEDAPHTLELGYTRSMMAFLLFQPAPAHIGMIGLGGGSLPKYCRHTMPQCRITVVEINPDVIALRDDFLIPPDDDRLQILCEDGAHWVGRQIGELDVLLVDGFDTGGQVAQLCTQHFYDECHAALTDDGVMVVNLSATDYFSGTYLARMRQSFGRNVAVVTADGSNNRIAIAIKGRAKSDGQIRRSLPGLLAVHGLPLATIAEDLLAYRNTPDGAGI
ncbi:class I SAM-dependent methyltransferase [Chitinimonas naiadis]